MTIDEWRRDAGFSAEIESASQAILEASARPVDVATLLSQWLGAHQPCVFGKLAAREHTITFCVLTEGDILSGDDHVRNQIQKQRNSWQTNAYAGLSSAFIIIVVSPIILKSRPDAHVAAFAKRLLQLYLLLEEVETDSIYLDVIELEVPVQAGRRAAIRWDVGVNYFCSQADRRWWHDHRIPAGMAFSMNSVGHMVHSRRLKNELGALEKSLLDDVDSKDAKMISLHEALAFAMRTIKGAGNTISGPATLLRPSKEGCQRTSLNQPLPNDLCPFDHSGYEGFYHTDETLPACYFLADVERPTDVKVRPLDFSYLYDNRLDNPSYARMGPGLRIRNLGKGQEVAKSKDASAPMETVLKRRRVRGSYRDLAE